MIRITIPATEEWDPVKEEFVNTKETTLVLEHSLVSLSKWESKWCKPFLGKDEKTFEETVDYVRCMTITQNVDQNVYNCLTNDAINQINKYIDAPMTATKFYEDRNGPKNRETITAELIYYWMVAYNIPFECQKWHLNRLLTLIRVRSIKLAPPKKRSRSEIAIEYEQLNMSRLKALSTKG